MDRKHLLEVDHYSFSQSGGAGVIATRMMQWQIDHGYHSRLITTISGSITKSTVRKPMLFITALIDFFIVRRRRDAPFFSIYRRHKPSVKSLNPSDKKIWHLHWTPGVLSQTELSVILKGKYRIVWTLHDLWPLTGGCHHSVGCLKYQNDCSNCPQVRWMFKSRVMEELTQKKLTIQASESLVVVSPSIWLERIARESSVFKSSDVRVIRNPVKSDFFRYQQQRIARNDETPLRVVFVATDLADQNKNLTTVINVIKKINQQTTNPIQQIVLTTIGGNSPIGEEPDVVNLGIIKDVSVLAETLKNMDVLVSFSTAENLPNVIGEAMASGVVVIARNVGGVSELVHNGETGYLVSHQEDLSNALEHFVAHKEELKTLSSNSMKWANENLSESVIMQQYEDLYLELLQN